MKKTISIISIILVLLSTITIAVSAAASSEDYGVAPCYNNTNSASITFVIDSSGKAKISLNCYGISTKTTKIVAETKLQKKFGLIWTNVSDAEWTDTTTNYYLNKSHTYQLSKTGTYRAKTTYTVSGTGGSNDSITMTGEDTY